MEPRLRFLRFIQGTGLAGEPVLRAGRVILAAACYLARAVWLQAVCAQVSFAPERQYIAGLDPTSAVIADFNRDGRMDVAVVNNSSDNVSVFLANPDGSLKPAVNYALGNTVEYITTGDFDGDGITDLAVAVGFQITLLLGKGDGTFRPGQSLVQNRAPLGLLAGDWNGDGLSDLAFGGFGTTLSVLVAAGNGYFRPRIDYTVGSDPSAMTSLDANGDGKMDLAVVNPTSGTVSILIGHGDGTFSPPTTVPITPAPFLAAAVAAADFNRDGRTDLAVGVYGVSPHATILMGNGDGSFQPPVTIASGSASISLAVADFNSDGISDLALADFGAIRVLLGDGRGGFGPGALIPLAGAVTPSWVGVADLRGTGQLDLVAVNTRSDRVSVFLDECPSASLAVPTLSYKALVLLALGIAGLGMHVIRAR
jgi:hypothetical protein